MPFKIHMGSLTALEFQTADLLVHGVILEGHWTANGYHGPEEKKSSLNFGDNTQQFRLHTSWYI